MAESEKDLNSFLMKVKEGSEKAGLKLNIHKTKIIVSGPIQVQVQVKITQLCSTPCNLMDCGPPGSSVHGDSPGKNIGVDCHALLQGIFPTQGSNPGLLHCWQILYQLSHKGSPGILEWVAYPFLSRSSQSRN